MSIAENVVAVIFDAFGTLLKVEGGRRPYLQLLKFAREQGRQPKPDDAQVIMQSALSFSQLARHLVIKIEPDQLTELERQLAEEVAGVKPYRDGLEAVELLQKRGFRIAVCSNLAAPYRAAIHQHYPNLDAYAFSCDLGQIKPAPEIYKATCEALSAPPSATLMIGDSIRCDRDGPRAVAIRSFLLARTGGGDYADLVSFAEHVCTAQQ